MTSSRIKVYELAKEIGVDSQNLVDVIQRLGIDIKNTMSILGTEEVRTVRDYYKKNKVFTRAGSAPPKSAAATNSSGGKTVTTEKRVGATVIRRRQAAKEVPVAAPVVEEAETQEAVETQGEEEIGSQPETQ